LLATKAIPVAKVVVVVDVVVVAFDTILLDPKGMKSQNSKDRSLNHVPVLVKIRSWSCR
jgi:hypothetical protein